MSMEHQEENCCQEIAERDDLRRTLCEERNTMNSIQKDHLTNYDEILSRNEALRDHQCEAQNKLQEVEDEYEQLCCKISQIDLKLEIQQECVRKLKCVESTKLENVEALKKLYLGMEKQRQKFLDKIQTKQSEKNDLEKEMTCVQKRMAEIITEQTELDKIICTEVDRKENFLTSINELKIKIDKLNKSFQCESTKLQTRLNEKSAEVIEIKENTKCKEMDIKVLKTRIAESEATLKVVLENFRKEKCKLELELCKIKEETAAITSKHASSKTKICETQKEITALENHMNEQKEVIRLLESTREQFLQKFKTLKEAKESTTAIMATLRGLQETERKNFEMQSALKCKEKCQLNELIKNQIEDIKKLQRQLFDVKISNCLSVVDNKMTDDSPLGSCITKLLRDNGQ